MLSWLSSLTRFFTLLKSLKKKTKCLRVLISRQALSESTLQDLEGGPAIDPYWYELPGPPRLQGGAGTPVPASTQTPQCNALRAELASDLWGNEQESGQLWDIPSSFLNLTSKPFCL